MRMRLARTLAVSLLATLSLFLALPVGISSAATPASTPLVTQPGTWTRNVAVPNGSFSFAVYASGVYVGTDTDNYGGNFQEDWYGTSTSATLTRLYLAGWVYCTSNGGCAEPSYVIDPSASYTDGPNSSGTYTIQYSDNWISYIEIYQQNEGYNLSSDTVYNYPNLTGTYDVQLGAPGYDGSYSLIGTTSTQQSF